MFLSNDEIKEMTGYVYPKKQINWLFERRIPYETDVKGRPKVLVSFIQSRLGDASSKSKKQTEPDIEAFRRRNDGQKKAN